ncbi:hypothetical protein [Streptomyces sp. H27-H1]|uniref:hypothetical protein n=1 Tax=Streptomyces sp. H27-H1 TaxID=2996461 RepID=UPI003B64183E
MNTPQPGSNPGDGDNDGSAGGPAPLTLHIKAGSGGAMTDEVGVITGDVTPTPELGPDGTIQVRIQYTGAEDWYTLTGSPAPLPPGGHAAFHQHVVDAVQAGGAAEVPCH